MSESLITKHLDLWTSAIEAKSTAGRGNNNKFDLYGIKKLRELILGLAVSGRLVPQLSEEPSAIQLLEKIKIEKERLIKLGELKKSKITIEPSDDVEELLPNGWCLATLGEISTKLTDGSHNPPKDSVVGYPMLSSQNINEGTIDFNNPSRFLNEIDYEVENKRTNVQAGDVLLTIVGSLGRSAVVPIDHPKFALQRSVAVIRTDLVPKYIAYYFSSPIVLKFFNENGKGTAQKGIYLGQLSKLKIAIPPLLEQNRIVAKIDELMALCDQIEQQTLTCMEAHTTLVETLLATLTASADADELAQNWNRISEHFDTLFTTEQSIDLLKQTILQLAVMGKLVPQDPEDEPASVLLEKIAAEKAQLIKDKKIKKEKPLPPISDDEKPFELPQGWEFAYLQDLCELITDGTHQTPTYSITGRPFVSAQCVKPFIFMPEKCRHVSEVDYQEYIKNRKPVYRDILLSRVGAGIGEAALIDINLDFAIYVSTALLKVFKVNMLPEYIVVWLNSPTGRIFSSKNTYGKGVSQGNLNLSLIRSFVISIPPVNEQKLIVSRVDNLMHLCANLNNKIQAANQQQLYLTDAIVEDALM